MTKLFPSNMEHPRTVGIASKAAGSLGSPPFRGYSSGARYFLLQTLKIALHAISGGNVALGRYP